MKKILFDTGITCNAQVSFHHKLDRLYQFVRIYRNLIKIKNKNEGIAKQDHSQYHLIIYVQSVVRILFLFYIYSVNFKA